MMATELSSLVGRKSPALVRLLTQSPRGGVFFWQRVTGCGRLRLLIAASS